MNDHLRIPKIAAYGERSSERLIQLVLDIALFGGNLDSTQKVHSPVR